MLSRFFTKQICVTTLVTLFALAGCDSDSNNNNSGSEPEVPKASAREARDADDLLEGPLARSSEGDYVLENDLLRVIIQKPGRNWFGLGTYGGNIIDVSMKNADGSFNPDHLEEFIIGINIENTANYTELRIENNGDDGNPAVICATGPDDLMEIFNASSAFRSLGASFPESADDRDLPIQIETCYSLAPEDAWVVIDTTLTNTSNEDLEIFLVENLLLQIL